MLWNLECPVGLCQREMKEIWRNLDCPPKNKELWSYVVKFEFSRPKGSSVIINTQILDILIERKQTGQVLLPEFIWLKTDKIEI